MSRHVHVIDDDADVREALVLLLGTAGHTVSAFAEARSFLAQQTKLAPGCIVTDLRMPQVTGLQLQEELAKRGCRWPIIVVTGHGDVNACRRAFKAGAVEFLTKPVDEHDLLAAIAKAATDLEHDVRQSAEQDQARRLLDRLTPREREVFDMVVRGLQTKDIALALDLSPRTIDVHRAHIAAKLETTAVVDMARLASRAASTSGTDK